MESWSTTTPTLKFEPSPAESLLSLPGEMYPSLFASESPEASVNSHDMLSPSPGDENQEQSELTPGSTPTGREKKPTKKRKSWGQVLPEPKTNLPTRKRAKTEDEKEQRRVERVLRNRRAAQSSRERKRLEVEALELRNKELEAMNHRLVEEVHLLRRSLGVPLGVVSRSAGSFPNPVTFSQELFSSHDGHNLAVGDAKSLEQLLTTSTTPSTETVNPASLSPALTPVPEEEDFEEETSVSTSVPHVPAPTAAKASPDATQHPAEMLCEDLQCRSAEAAAPWWLATSEWQMLPLLTVLIPLQLLLASTSAALSICQRPLMQIAFCLKAGLSIPQTPLMLNTIIKLVTTPRASRSRGPTSTSPNSLPTSPISRLATSSSRSNNLTLALPPTRPSSTLRLRSLRKILTCSPFLARPLLDATMAVLRLVASDGFEVDRVSEAGDASAVAASVGMSQRLQQFASQTPWLNAAALPSKETLLALLWVLKVEERRLEMRSNGVGGVQEPGRPKVKSDTPLLSAKKHNFILTVSSSSSFKRSWEAEQRSRELRRLKRRRSG